MLRSQIAPTSIQTQNLYHLQEEQEDRNYSSSSSSEREPYEAITPTSPSPSTNPAIVSRSQSESSLTATSSEIIHTTNTHTTATTTTTTIPSTYTGNNTSAATPVFKPINIDTSWTKVDTAVITSPSSTSTATLTTPPTPPITINKRDTPSTTPKRPGGSISRTMSEKIKGLFRRSNSHSGHSPPSTPQRQQQQQQQQQHQQQQQQNQQQPSSPSQIQFNENVFDTQKLSASIPTTGVTHTPTTGRKTSVSVSARNSPWQSPSVTPGPTNGSPSSTIDADNEGEDGLKRLSKGNRSNTGFSFRKTKVVFNSASKQDRNKSATNLLAPSLDQIEEERPKPIKFQPDFARPAATGAGLKARRLSINLPDEFQVDTIALDKEFTSASKLPGRSKTIGTGATSMVKLYNRKGNGDEVYAVKEFRKKGADEDADEYDKKVKSEYTIAHSLHHPNIVECVRLCTNAGRWNVVMEYCSVGEVFSLVQKGYLGLDDKLCLFKQTVRGVDYLHNHGIAHRDIKLENLLMTETGRVKITDFGVSEVFAGEHPGLRAAGGECGKNMNEVRRCSPGLCGSLPYMAPEVIAKKGDYDPRPLDVWSCAILLLSFIYNGQPWNQANAEKDSEYAKFEVPYLKFVEANPEEPFPLPTVGLGRFMSNKYLPKPAVRALLIKMLHPVPDKRLSIQGVMNDRYFKTIDCCGEEYSEDNPTGLKRTNTFDASQAKSGTMKVMKLHNHLPPVKHRLPQHRFDMGDGWN